MIRAMKTIELDDSAFQQHVTEFEQDTTFFGTTTYFLYVNGNMDTLGEVIKCDPSFTRFLGYESSKIIIG